MEFLRRFRRCIVFSRPYTLVWMWFTRHAMAKKKQDAIVKEMLQILAEGASSFSKLLESTENSSMSERALVLQDLVRKRFVRAVGEASFWITEAGRTKLQKM